MAEAAVTPEKEPTGAPESEEAQPPVEDTATPPEGGNAPTDVDTDDGGTALDADPEPPPAAETWPEDWRDRIIAQATQGLDESEAKSVSNILRRFQSPETMGKAFADLRRQVSAGTYRKALSPDASEEEIAAWRADNGIPESPEKYEIDLDGRVLPDEDKPLVDEFLKTAHGANFPPEQVNTALRWYADLVEQQAEQQIAADKQAKMDAVDELRLEWGPEYRANINAIKTLLGDELSQQVMEARDVNGNILGNNPQVLKFFAGLASEMYPAASLGIHTEDPGTHIQGELDKLRGMMADGSYWAGPKDANGETEHQRRYNQLVKAQERLNGRK